MKQLVWLVSLVMVFSVAFLGCKKKEGVDTAKLQKSFQTADNATQSSVQKAVVAIESADYGEALTELKKIAANAKLTPEQQATVKDTIEQVTKTMGAKAKEAVGEMQKALPK